MSDPTGDTRRLAATFRRLTAQNRRAFIPFIMAGDPAPELTIEVMDALVDAGADVLELGIPFSDPLADGPTIQAAAWRALSRGVNVSRVLTWTRDFAAKSQVPVVLFSYLNPILRYGPERFVADAGAVGAAGLLLTDLPLGEDSDLESILGSGGLEWVRLIAPTTPVERRSRILQAAQGFVYYISRTGVTGERERLRQELTSEVGALRQQTNLPIAVGFGISSPDQARAVASAADGVVVGSALVRTLNEKGLDATRRLASELRAAIDAATA
ncbi:MAG: tryptophan synthase subunit alpha [Gemmatimonadales bacterium]